MKIKIAIVILLAVSLGLIIALVATKKQADEARSRDSAAILEFSNQLDSATINLNDLRQVNLMLTNDLDAARQALEATSNNLYATSAQLAGAKSEIENDQNQITNLNGRIGDLEAQNKVLDERASTLSNNIVALDAKIAATQQQLALSLTNNAFLAAELRKQMAQKAELERRFNDVDEVRAQVKKLRNELFEARRLQWISQGTSPDQQLKGAAQLMRRTSPPSGAAGANRPPKPASPNYDLNIEVGSDGSVHIIQPANSPVTATPPPAGPQDTPAQAAARAALLKQMNGTNPVAPATPPR